MERRKYLKLIGAGSVASIAGCAGNSNNGNGGNGGGTTTGSGSGSSEPITVAALEPQSGPFSPWATEHLRGLRLGVDEINNSDMLDQNIEIVVTDTGADPGEADSAFRRHVEQDGAVVATGVVSSDVGIRTAQTAEELQVPNLLAVAGSSEILSRDTRYVFRTGWPQAQSHGRADAQYFQQNNISSVGAIVADYAWGRSIEAALEQFTPDDIELTIEAAPVGTSDFRSYLRQMPNDVELMDFVGHPPGSVSAASQMADLGMEQPILGVDPPQRVIIDALGSRATDVITRHLAVPTSDQFTTLGEQYGEEYDATMFTYAPIGYINAMMVAEAVREGSGDPTELANYIRNNSFDVMYQNPLEYTEWGEFRNLVIQYSRLTEGAPSYYSDGDYHLEVVGKSESLPAPEP
ncbi:ABC transporter substrate-binding protein [Halobellus clavatus]|uniref:Branched-chain amino acid transport system substrate-binding protein n=1 Tax=Halobellus clavatus TaxID=660517 RepID=A0A1H3IUC8_9EURY|nr:ABC transporter substrate-binding protein [Halobellus clavatus]SDY31363.1 branched-chain amino acid transport system substrate-binding protein [Halobellus clavatus]